MIKQDILENQVNTVYLAIGSNLGNKSLNIEKTKIKLINYKINIIKTSNKYESLSWPNIKKPSFLNIVIKIKTPYSPKKLLNVCHEVERSLGRKRSKKNEPRICDIDIIDFEQKIFNYKDIKLIIPHAEMHKRNFVLIPLFEISSDWTHPKKKINIAKLLISLNINDLRAIKKI